MKNAVGTAFVFALASLCLCSGAGAKIVTIEIPRAQFVGVESINDKRQVIGSYGDSSVQHGFIWQPHGALVTFDVPGALQTVPVGISATGVVTGRYSAPGILGRGFVRAADGSITTFNVPHGLETIPYGVNRKGWSVGTWSRGRPHLFYPFLRAPSGPTKEFSVPGADGGAIAVAVNSSRTVAGEALFQGTYNDQGFVRTLDGVVTVFGDPDFYTAVAGINDTGTIAGWFSGQQPESFVRTSDGTITTFVGPSGSIGTFASVINNSGTIVGSFADSSANAHGFLRAADGTFTPFDPEGSVDTEVTAINNKGAIAGTYTSKDGARLGFAGTPRGAVPGTGFAKYDIASASPLTPALSPTWWGRGRFDQ